MLTSVLAGPADGPAPRRDAELRRSGYPSRARVRVSAAPVQSATTEIQRYPEIGYLLALEDAAQSAAFWDLASAMGRVAPRFEGTSNDMLRSLAAGNAAIGYNTLTSYALRMSRTDATIGYVFPKDYTIVLSRIMFIGKNDANPNAARLWVDYILSKRGQTVIAGPAALFSLRDDVEGEATAAGLKKLLGDHLRPIQIGPNLLEGLDRSTRDQFLQRWRETAGSR